MRQKSGLTRRERQRLRKAWAMVKPMNEEYANMLREDPEVATSKHQEKHLCKRRSWSLNA